MHVPTLTRLQRSQSSRRRCLLHRTQNPLTSQQVLLPRRRPSPPLPTPHHNGGRDNRDGEGGVGVGEGVQPTISKFKQLKEVQQVRIQGGVILIYSVFMIYLWVLIINLITNRIGIMTRQAFFESINNFFGWVDEKIGPSQLKYKPGCD